MVTPKNHKKGVAMTKHSASDDKDSVVDAWAILALIVLVVSTAVFWVSHQ